MMTNETYTTKNNQSSTVAEQAKQAADSTKQQAQTAAANAKEGAKEGARQVTQEATKLASELGNEAKKLATDVTQDVSHKAEERVNEQKGYAAERLSGVASVLRETGKNFRTEDEQAFAQYADSAADQVDRFAGYLRDQNVNDLVRDVQQLAKRQPELFVAGALAAGFLLGRFFKSSEQRGQSTRYQGGYQSSYRGDPDWQYRNPGATSQYGAPRYGESTYRAQPYTQPYGGQYGQGSTQYEDRWNDRYSSEQGNEQPGQRSYGSSYGSSTVTSGATSGPINRSASQAEPQASVQYEPQSYVAGSQVSEGDATKADNKADNKADKEKRTEGENK
jgi:hypothetical protein